MTTRRIFLSLIALAFGVASFAQSAEKQLAKANKYIDKNKVDKAEELLTECVSEYPNYGKAWDLLVDIKFYNYRNAPKTDGLMRNITVTTTTNDGSEPSKDADSLAQMLMSLLNGISPKETYWNEAVYTMKMAMAKCNNAEHTSIYLRNYLFDEDIDSNVSDEAYAVFDRAEKQFVSKNYNEAAKLYGEALEIEPMFYNASLYLGDSYYAMGEYVQAIEKFKLAVEKFPKEVEPRKYLIDAYLNNGNFDEALFHAKESLKIFPDLSMTWRFVETLDRNNKEFTVKWIPRQVLPNTYANSKSSLNRYYPPKEEVNEDWSNYQKAKDFIKEFCDEKGLITKSNDLTKSHYAEVYAWEYMLDNTTSSKFDQVKKIREEGYLESYIMITQFHIDFLDQFEHFVTTNEGQIEKYFDAYTVNY